MIRLFNRKKSLENELPKKVKIFGEDYTVEIEYCKVENPELNLCTKSIKIYLPYKYRKNRDIEILKIALQKMYDEIARIEIENIMEETRVMLNGLAPENYLIKRIPNKLAKMLQNKTIIINPDIVKYNKEVLRYVVLYEFCHLKYKTNCKNFWQMLEKYMPCYEEYEYIREVA